MEAMKKDPTTAPEVPQNDNGGDGGGPGGQEGRQRQGLLIATTKRLQRKSPHLWLVPSQTSDGATYAVSFLGEQPVACTCADHAKHPDLTCKHQCAVRYVRMKLIKPDGRVVVDEMRPVRPSYWRDSSGFDQAQIHEKEHFRDLLAQLVAGVVQAPHNGPGRKRAPLRDLVYAAILKVYLTWSGRRVQTDLRDARALGLLGHVPCHAAIARFLGTKETLPLMRMLVRESAAPLAEAERIFAVDATGFHTSIRATYHDIKYRKYEQMFANANAKPAMPIRINDFDKAHLICGTRTMIVPDVVVTTGHGLDSGDVTHFQSLVEGTAARYDMLAICADKAYLAARNLEVAAAVGAVPYIPFRSTNTAGTAARNGSAIWRHMWAYFQSRPQEFWDRYGSRQMVEATNSSIKRVFGSTLRSRTLHARHSEIMAKVICHNLVVLVHAIYGMDLEPRFWISPASVPGGPTVEAQSDGAAPDRGDADADSPDDDGSEGA